MDHSASMQSDFLKFQSSIKTLQEGNISSKTNWTMFYGAILMVLAYLNWDNAMYGKYLVLAGICVFFIAYRVGIVFTKSVRIIQDFEALLIPNTSQDLLINGHQVIGYVDECKKLAIYVTGINMFNAITACGIVIWIVSHMTW